MVLPGRPRIEKLRNIFLFVFLILVVTIISTPLLISRGFSLFQEETWEAILLLAQVSLAWNIFRLYEKAVAGREEEIEKLEKEYQRREKQLLEAFAYLGKVNVQISLIKDFLGKLKAPASKKEVKEYLDDILRMALAISQKEWMTVRIVNTENMQTIAEHWASSSSKTKTSEVKIGNREIVEMAHDKNLCNERNLCVLSSTGSKPYKEKAFLVFLENNNVDREVLGFLKAAVNQCEIIHTLFVLGHGQK
ncbi:MAG: hypothetical protein A3J76_00435 [Candidatus Moranbacteria bacterium RBG_13_45_13]|nr:MAG: hypothetical protein A3J76_00435 [Candidatus Moranbacteria bacterium RBG_13_45_13]